LVDNSSNSPREVAQRIAAKVKGDGGLRSDITQLSRMDMTALLDVLDRLKKAGAFEDFTDRVTSEHQRIGVATLTVRGDFDAQWQALFPKLNDADQRPILARAPADATAAAPGAKGKAPEPAGQTTEDEDDYSE